MKLLTPSRVVGESDAQRALRSHLSSTHAGGVGRLTALARRELSAHGLERLAAADARGGHDTSSITERGIRGLFWNALELAQQEVWAYAAGLYMPSDTKTEKHRWLGQVAQPRAAFGGLNATPLRDFSFDIENEDFELSLEISLHDWRRDKIDAIARRVGEFGMSWADHWNVLAVRTMEASTNGDTAYDGVAFFSASHVLGDQTSIRNLLTATQVESLNVSDTNRPTKAEAAAILADLAAYFSLMVDDQGRPTNQGARKFLLLCHPVALPGFKQAIHDQLYVQGGSNELKNLNQEFVAVGDPRLSSQDVVYMFRLDGRSAKGLILQEELAPTMNVIGPGSEHAVINKTGLYVSEACRNVKPGEFRHVLKATLS